MSEDDEDDNVPIQLAIHGLTLADDCTARQAATALWGNRGKEWCVELVYWLRVEAVLAAKARRVANLVEVEQEK